MIDRNDERPPVPLAGSVPGSGYADGWFQWLRRGEPGSGWTDAPERYERLCRLFVESGAPMQGIEVASEGLVLFPGHTGLRQAEALAHARSGNVEAANTLLERLRGEGHLDDETLGTLARTHKDLALEGDRAARPLRLQTALDLYAQAWRHTGSRWTGINVATLATLLGQHDLTRSVVAQIQPGCMEDLRRLPGGDPERYWVLATLGEAALCTGDLVAAEEWYRQASLAGQGRYGDLSATRRNARLLMEDRKEDTALIDIWLPMPAVVLFSGHMIDRPGRPQPRFPPEREGAVYEALLRWLRRHNGLIGFSSAACGADLLFLEAVHALGGETHVVLPYERDAFLEDSVAFTRTGAWRERFDQQLENSRIVHASASRLPDDGLSYEYTNQLIHGLGLLRARDLGTHVAGLAVWDGLAGDGPGGVASAVSGWQAHGVAVHRVRIESLTTPDSVVVHPPRESAFRSATRSGATEGTVGQATLSLLFADVAGFSRLTDAEQAAFVPSCLGLVARLIRLDEAVVLVRETWGDGLFLAFTDPAAAGRFALDLRDAMSSTDWLALGFELPLAMRFALHAGPVHLTKDPVTGLRKCVGAHVSRAARLEPRTPPGRVYASEAFAALAELEGVTAFRCDYVKQLDWAKRYGTFPAYVVRRPRPRP